MVHAPVPVTGVLAVSVVPELIQIFCALPALEVVGKPITVIVPVALTVPQPPVRGML